MLMTERTAAALTKLDELLRVLKTLPPDDRLPRLIEDTEALQRAVAAFHMEAIRFRMYAVDRALKHDVRSAEAETLFEELRKSLEEAGFHTRSHAAP
jgi:hypothetical protein